MSRSSNKARKTSDARPHTDMDDPNPRASFFSGHPPRVITSSPQIAPQIVEGPPNEMYTSQQAATWESSRQPPASHNYARPPLPSEFPPQNEYHPSTTFGHSDGRPGGFGPPMRSFTHPSPSSNPPPDYNTRPPPQRNASQFTNLDKAKISDGHFATLTDHPPTQGSTVELLQGLIILLTSFQGIIR